MNSRPSHRPAVGRTVLLAGWLFADLLLLLLVVALGSLPREERAADQRPATPGSPGPTPSATQAAARGLVVQPCSFTVRTGSDASVTRQLTSQLRAAHVADRTAGFVLSFGTAPDANPGQAAARKVNSAITKGLPRFRHAPKRGYWRGGNLGTVRIDVFFLAASDGSTSLPHGCHSSNDD